MRVLLGRLVGTVEEASDAEARKNFDVNVFGLLNVLRATLPHLREKRAGHIFDISSIGGFVGTFCSRRWNSCAESLPHRKK